jgi:hypothetical protein
MRIRSALAIAVLLAGCGGDGGESLGPAPPDLNGNWTFNWANMNGTIAELGSFSCSITGVNATLTQVENTFTGQINGDWLMTCMAAGQSESETLTGGVITHGLISGNRVSFSMATDEASQTGTISGNSMSGEATWRVNFGTPYGVVVVRGHWGAVRNQATAAAAEPLPATKGTALTAAMGRAAMGH